MAVTYHEAACVVSRIRVTPPLRGPLDLANPAASRVAMFTLPAPATVTVPLAGTIALSVPRTTALSSFIAQQPGARCEWWGLSAAGAATRLASRRCGESSALQLGITNTGIYSRIRFQVHASDFASTTWTVSTTRIVN